MAFLNQLKSLIQLPGALKQARQSQTQAEAIESRLAQAQSDRGLIQPTQQVLPTQPVVTSVLPQRTVIRPAGQLPQVNPQPAIQPPPQVNPQIETIQKSLTELATEIQGLKTANVPSPQVLSPQVDEFKKIEEALLTVQTKTPEEERIEKLLANLMASKELGLRHIEEQPIEMEAITGQSAALERRAATQAIPLQTQLAQIQARRQAAVDVAKTRLDIEKARTERMRPDEEKVDEYTNEAGQRVVAFRDKKTGKVRSEILGKVQAKVQAKEKKYEAGNIGEYQFYAEQEKKAGRTPISFSAFRKEKTVKTVVDKLTLDERKKLYPSLPLSLVGKNEANVIAELESSQVPSWYKELRREQVGIGPVIIKQEEWDLFRKQVLDTMTGQAQKGAPKTDEIPSWVTE